MNNLAKIKMDVPFKLIKQNQTRILAINTPGNGLCYMEIIIKVGWFNETKKDYEISHFLEHLNGQFTSTKFPNVKNVLKMLDQMGASSNASTSMEETSFYIAGNVKFFDKLWEIFSESFRSFSIDNKSLENERNAIREELNEELNEQWIKLDEKLYKTLWGTNSMSRTVKERLASVNKLTRKNILKFREKFYIPSFMTIIISGDLDIKKSLKVGKTLANGLIKTSKIPRTLSKFKLGKTRRRVVFVKNSKVKSYKLYVIFQISIKKFSKFQKDINILSRILTSGDDSILWSKLRVDEGLVYSISSSAQFVNVSSPDLSYFEIETTVDKSNLVTVAKIILEQLKTTFNDKIFQQYFESIRNVIIRDALYEAATKVPSDMASEYSRRVPWNLEVKTIRKFVRELLECVKTKNLSETVKKLFRNDRMIIAYSGKSPIKQMNNLRL